MDRKVGKRAFGNTAASRAAGNHLAADEGACMGANWVTVAAHAIFVAVENGRVDEVGVLCPIPVGLVAFVVTLGTQCGLVGPDVVAVPVHEVCGRMDRGRHVHVHNYEVVVAALCAGVLAGGKLAGLFEDAFYSPGVLFSLILGKVATVVD